MNPYPRYRPSGVEWLGEVPEHWEVLPTKHASQIVMGQSPPSDTYQDEPVERPFLQGNAEFGRSSPTPKWYCDAAPKVVEAGALLLSVRAPVGALNGADQTYGIGRGLCGVVANPDRLEQRFAWWTLHVTRRALEPLAVGSTYDAVSAAEVGELCLPLPPLDEQRAIAAYLDRETERIDALVAKKRLLIERLEEYRTALITRTVTRGLPPEAARAAGLDPSPRLKPSGVEWLGDVPEHWEVRRLRTLADITTGSKDTVDREDGGEYPFFVRSQTVERIDTWSFDGEAVLTAGDGVGVGKVFHYINGRFDYHQRMYKFSGFKRISGEFFFQYFRTMLRFVVLEGTAKSTVDSLRLPMLQDFPVSFPPLREQHAITVFLDQETARIDRLASQVERAIERSQEYRTALITAAVTGKIDVRESATGAPGLGGSPP